MKVKDRNQSSVKTKAAIRTAFAEMVKEKGELDKITVTELVKRAHINRSTFYLHYSDIYDIAAELEHSLMSDVLKCNPASKEEFFTFTEELLNMVQKNENLYRQIHLCIFCASFAGKSQLRFCQSRILTTLPHRGFR